MKILKESSHLFSQLSEVATILSLFYRGENLLLDTVSDWLKDTQSGSGGPRIWSKMTADPMILMFLSYAFSELHSPSLEYLLPFSHLLHSRLIVRFYHKAFPD